LSLARWHPRLRLDGLEVFTHGGDDLHAPDVAVAGHDDVGLEPFEFRQDFDPPSPVGVWVGEDREQLVLDEIAREEDALLRLGPRGPDVRARS
jgi:hypothetical protein